MKPLSLTDRQLRLIEAAAKAVPPTRREEFLQQVAKHLTAEPTDAAVQAVVNVQLDTLPHHFMCDSASNKGAIMARPVHDDANFDTVVTADGRRVKILKDGHRSRTPMFAMDALQRSVAAAHRPGFRTAQPRADASSYWQRNKDALLVTDGSSDPYGLHKPGFRVLDNAHGRNAKETAYAEYLHDDTNAYKAPTYGFGGDPRLTGQGSHDPVSAREGSPCTKDGYAGVLRRDANGSWLCDISAQRGGYPPRRHDAAGEKVCPGLRWFRL